MKLQYIDLHVHISQVRLQLLLGGGGGGGGEEY